MLKPVLEIIDFSVWSASSEISSKLDSSVYSQI